MDAKATLGCFIRQLREQASLTQEQLASKAGITYQYLSGLENGRENFSIEVLASVCKALKCPMPELVAGAFAAQSSQSIPAAVKACFRPQTPLPQGLTVENLEMAMNEAQRVLGSINNNLVSKGAKPLYDYIQGNNFSGLVSNVFCDAMNEHTPFKHNSHQAYPDLINHHGGVGLEVKTTIQIGKGGESHNGHSGWHVVACYRIDRESYNIKFVHIMCAVLNGHQHAETDWTYVGSKVNAATGSRRTETYNTNIFGTTKLRDGSVYLDPTCIHITRWKTKRRGPKPAFSPWT